MTDPSLEDIDARFGALNTAIEEGLVCRHSWTDLDTRGRERACLLLQIAPEARTAPVDDYHLCPSSRLPSWLLVITPWIDDSGSEEQWPSVIRRYSKVIHEAARVLDDEGWHRAHFACRGAVVQEAMKHDDDEDVVEACRQTVAMCRATPLTDSMAARSFVTRRKEDGSSLVLCMPRLLLDEALYESPSSIGYLVELAAKHAWRPSSDEHALSTIAEYAADAISNLGDEPPDVAADRIITILLDVIEAETKRCCP